MLKKVIAVSALALGIMMPTLAQETPMLDMTRYLNTVQGIEAVVEDNKLSLVITGVLSDGCQADTEIQTQRSNNVWFIDLFRTLPVDTACTKALLPFEITVPADELLTLDAEAILPSHVVVNDKMYRLERAMVDPAQGSTSAPIIAPMFTELVRANLNIETVSHIINENGTISVRVVGVTNDGCSPVIVRSYPDWTNPTQVSIQAYSAVGLADMCAAVQLPFDVTIVTENSIADATSSFLVNGITFEYDPSISTNVQEFIIQRMGVEDVQVLVLESFPPQYNIQVSGTTDGCPQPIQVVVRQIVDNYVYAEVVRTVPPMQACTMIAKQYMSGVTILSTILPTGTINLWVNDEERMTFEN